jgi:citrate synthase
MSEKAKLVLNDKTVECPIIEGSEGEKAIDISKLRAETGFITYDNGLGNTGACLSKITFIDGEKGVLKHRGITLEEWAAKSTFRELSYALIYDKLPNQAELDQFANSIKKGSRLPEGIMNLIKSFDQNAHPMAVTSAAIVALSAYYPEYCDPDIDEKKMEEVIPLMMGSVKSIAAATYRHLNGLEYIAPNDDLTYCQDFLNMMFGKVPEGVVSEALDVLLMLHADHEQNCSATAVRVIGSSKANIFASLSGGVDALWGPSHGGANQAVLEMLEAIEKDGGGYEKFLGKAKDKEDPFRLMGFGHRVYKNFDPRARIIKKHCDKVLSELSTQDDLLDIAKGLEKSALEDDYFAQRKLYPNVDFYSGIIYKALGIPTNMFTVMFVIGRLPGWIAQWKEMVHSDGFRITRPRQIFNGATEGQLNERSSR